MGSTWKTQGLLTFLCRSMTPQYGSLYWSLINTEHTLMPCFYSFFFPKHSRDKRWSVVLYLGRHNCYFIIFNTENLHWTDAPFILFFYRTFSERMPQPPWSCQYSKSVYDVTRSGYVSPLRCDRNMLKIHWATMVPLIFKWLSIRVINHFRQSHHKSLIHPGKYACPWWQIIGH